MKQDNYYEKIKETLINNEITRKVKNYSINKSDLESYYNVGKLLIEAQGKEIRAKYGDNLLKTYSLKLVNEVNKQYNVTFLKRLRQFYLIVQKGATVSHQLCWSHYVELIPLDNINTINYYIEICKNQNLSVRQLREKIKSNEYERLPESTKNKLINKEDINVKDFIKDPIIINNPNNIDVTKEKTLQKLILENIEAFLKELGDGFSFIGSEYKISIGKSYNYIDLLLFNINFNCYIVVELKVSELKKEHIGRIEIRQELIK